MSCTDQLSYGEVKYFTHDALALLQATFILLSLDNHFAKAEWKTINTSPVSFCFHLRNWPAMFSTTTSILALTLITSTTARIDLVRKDVFATVTVPAGLWARQDGPISDIGPGCSSAHSGLPAICPASFPAFTPGGPTPTASPTPTPPAQVKCDQQNEDPDQGIEQQGCICSQGTVTKTLPLFTTGVDYDSSCAYTDLATKTIAITQDWGSPYTNTAICSACTPTTDFGVGKCTSLPDCLPQTPSATLQVGSSPVPVGTLTSQALYTSISSAIATLCPATATQCDQETQIKIPDISYVEEDSLMTDGELIVQIDSSGYNDSSILRSLIGMAAQSFASSATGKNCADVSYTVEELRKRDHPYPQEEKINVCNAGHFASPQFYSQWWREAPNPGPQDYLSVEITFKTGPGGEMFCDFIHDLLELCEAAFTPELLGEEQVADEEFGTQSSHLSAPFTHNS